MKQFNNRGHNAKAKSNAKAKAAGLVLLLTILLTGMLLLVGCGSSAQDDGEEAQATATTAALETEAAEEGSDAQAASDYTFRYDDLLQSHYKKHGIDMGFASPEEYLAAANGVIDNPNALTKTEAEDGDLVYYVEETNEFVVLSTDGYIRTYFLPDSGKRYFDKQ